jgi:hypothetical protein
MRQTPLKPERDGYYRRNLGYLAKSDGRFRQLKISLGTVRRAAQERLGRISAIWQRIESEARQNGEQPVWDGLSLKIAKAIGNGDSEYRAEAAYDNPLLYARFVEAVAKNYPEIVIRPADEELYRAGKELEQAKFAQVEDSEKDLLMLAADIKSAVLETEGNDRKYVDLLGDQTLHQAFDAYSEHIADEKFDGSEDAVNDTGKTKQSMVKQLKTYLDDRPLESLSDFYSVDRLFGVLRSRPVTFRYGKPMARKTADKATSLL